MDEPTGRTPARDVIVTTFPSSLRFRCGMAALVSHHVPKTFTSNVRRNTSSVSASRSWWGRSEEHTSELQSLMRISYAVFCLKKKQRYRLPMDSLSQSLK